MKKTVQALLTLALTLTLALSAVPNADASNEKVMWGKTELKIGQIGKVTILKDVSLVQLEKDGNLKTLRTLKKGDEYRVYQYKGQHNGLYGLGNSSFVQKNAAKIKYETPSKSKLALINNASTSGSKQDTGTKPKLDPIVVKSELSSQTREFIEKNATQFVNKEDGLIVKFPGNPQNFGLINASDRITVVFTPFEEKSNSLYAEATYLIFKDLGYEVKLDSVKSFIKDYNPKSRNEIKVGERVYMKSSGVGVSVYTK